MTPASQIPFDPKKTYLAAPMNDDHHDRTAFRFKGRERQGDADLTQDEKGRLVRVAVHPRVPGR